MAYAAWSVVANEQPSAAKWNILGTNDSSFNDGSGIADSAILPKHLFTGTGSSWGWTSYAGTMKANGGTAPTYTATDVGKYIQVGKTVYVQFYKANSAGGTAGAGAVQLEYTLPITANTSTVAANTITCGTGNLLNGAGSGFVTLHIANSTGVLFKQTSTGNFLNSDQSNATRQLYGSFVYEAV